MYLRGAVEGSSIGDALELPRNLLVNQNAVYVLQDSTIRLHPVQVVRIREENAIVRGLPDRTPILAQPVPGAFDGMKVAVAGRMGSGARSSSGSAMADE